jgi:endoglucanase
MDARSLPRWRGFNLLEKFSHAHSQPFLERDFEWMAKWGFDFARLPLSYRCWASGDPATWCDLDERVLAEVDQAVYFGKQHGVHVNVNLHRAPGYCVNPPAEPLDLWTDERALEACAFHWAHLAERYRGIDNEHVSFDLLNEPADIAADAYVKVVERLVGAIREKDPGRLIIADGLLWGRKPVPELARLGIGQSTRGYDPMVVSHYKAGWVQGSESYPAPTWPLTLEGEETFDKERLRAELIRPWQALEAQGVGIHVGECGAFQHTPHATVLAWFRDLLELWEEADWGWALWNFRGSFGILDSGRTDVDYEPFYGYQLDRELLELLLAH